MKYSTYLLSVLCLAGCLRLSAPVLAQTPTEATPTEESEPTGSSLARQFQWMRERSNNYQDYKVIKHNILNSFWKNVQDTLIAHQKEQQLAKSEISSLKQEIAGMKRTMNEKDQIVQRSEYEKTHITVMGIDLGKETYIFINGIIILSLLVVLGITIMRYKQSNKIAVEKRSEFEEVNRELNAHRQRARDKETVMARELQTERNKIEELNQKIASLKKQVHS